MLLALALMTAAPPRADPLRRRRSASDMPALMALYRDLHANPELSMQETRAPAKLAAEAQQLGFDVTTGVGKTGVVAVHEERPRPGAAAARRHGRAAGRGADRPALRQPGPRHQPRRRRERRHARLRPRHPHDRLGRHRPAAGGDARPMVGHPGHDRPARRGDRPGRQGDARGRPLHPLPQADPRHRLPRCGDACRPA